MKDQTGRPSGRVYFPLAPLGDQIAAWRSEIRDRRVRRIYDHVVKTIDHEAFKALQRRYREQARVSGDKNVIKYLDIAPWLSVHARIAAFLGIDRGRKRSILDIGAGGGQFLAIAKSYGHEVIALDLAEPAIYRDLLEMFGIPRIEGGVSFRMPLPTAVERYDLIVIHGQLFDVDPVTHARWQLPQWASFIEYLTTEHIRFPGELFIGLNRSVGPEHARDYLWPLVELAKQHGARTDREKPFMHFALSEPLVLEDVDGFEWLDPDDRSRAALDSTSRG